MLVVVLAAGSRGKFRGGLGAGRGFNKIFYHVLAILSLFTLYLANTKWPIRVDVSLDKNS